MEYSYTKNIENISNIKNIKKKFCINCGKIGHEQKKCKEPITSFGIINFKITDAYNETSNISHQFTNNNTYIRIVSNKYPNVKCYISKGIKIFDNNINYKINDASIPFDENCMKKLNYYKDRIQFMMVSRKYSLGYIQFLRGKYDMSEPKSIIELFEQMTEKEIANIQKYQYDDLLYQFLNRHNESQDVVLNKIYEGKYSNEYCEAKMKFNLLYNSYADDNCDIPCNLNFYLKHINPRWNNPEWGFPKGRRDGKTEENLSCARREFEEETGIKNYEYSILNKIEPLEEKLIGTNGVEYRHIYYLSVNKNENTNDIDNIFEYDKNEIGEVRWMTFDEAIAHIRPYHRDKKSILTKIFLFIVNYLINSQE